MFDMSMSLIVICALAFFASITLTLCLRTLAESTGTLDIPNERSSHIRPTPRGGGISFVLVTLAVAVYVAMVGPAVEFGTYAICALAVAAVSLIDDVRHLPAGIRLLVHFATAGAFVVLVQPFDSLQGIPGPVMVIAMVLWVVSLTNVFNFMDGIDGIAASQGVIAFGAMAALGFLSDDGTLALVCVVAAFATGGFLVINWPPARIFMGDVGSAFLGFSCGCLSMISGDSRVALVALFATWPFCFDATATLGLRLLRRENILRSHRSHFYQRLVIAGCSHAFVTTLYAGGAIVAGVIGVTAALGALNLWIAALVLMILSAGLIVFVRMAERSARLPMPSSDG